VRVIGRAAIYHGPMGTAGYQSLVGRMLPLRGIAAPFRSTRARLLLGMVSFLQPGLRAWRRNRRWAWAPPVPALAPEMPPPDAELCLPPRDGRDHTIHQEMLLANGWKPGDDHAPWDLERDGVRVLFATERGDGEVKQILARVWGRPADGLSGECF